MDVFKTRKDNLRRLIDTRFDGVVLRFAEAMAYKPPHVHRWLTDAASAQKMSETSAREIEQQLGLRRGWMDTAEHDAIEAEEQLLLTLFRQATVAHRHAVLTLLENLVTGDPGPSPRLDQEQPLNTPRINS